MWRNKSIYIYFFSYFFNAGISFVVVSLLTHHISTEDYGIINLYSSFLIFLMPFISGGIIYPLSVEFFKRPGPTYKQVFSNAQAIPLISLGLFSLLCFVFQKPLSQFLRVPAGWIYVMPITVWWIMIGEMVMMISRNKSNAVQFAFFSIGKNVTEILLTVWLVVGLKMTWDGRLLSASLAPVIMGILSIYVFYRWKLLSRKIDWTIVKQIFLLGLPLMFERLAVFVLGYSDKYFIDQFDINKTKEVGLYGLGSQLASIIYLVIISLNSAYHPHLFKQMAAGFKGGIHRSTWLFIGVSAVAVAGLYIGIPIIFRFFISPEYADAKPYAYMLIGGYFMWAVYSAFLGYLLYLEKNKQIFYISLMGMALSLGANAFMVPRYGAFGAAITSIGTYTMMALVCFLYARHCLNRSVRVFK